MSTARFLLDTHVLFWAAFSPDRLSETARATLSDAGSIALVSAISAYELAIKHRQGKLPGAEPLLADLPAQLRRLRVIELPVNAAHAVRAGALDWEHRDPFDRMLAAQSVLEGCVLLTADRALRSFAGVDTRW